MFRPQKFGPSELKPYPRIYYPSTRNEEANVPLTPRPRQGKKFFENGHPALRPAVPAAAPPALAVAPRPAPAPLSHSQVLLRKEQFEKQKLNRARENERKYRAAKAVQSAQKRFTISARAQAKSAHFRARGQEQAAELQAEAESNEAFVHLLNDPNANHTTRHKRWFMRPRVGKNMSEWKNESPSSPHTQSNRNRLMHIRRHYLNKPQGSHEFNENNAASYKQHSMGTRKPPSSPVDSPRFARANFLFNKSPSLKHVSPRSNSAERVARPLSPSAFKSKKARKPSPKRNTNKKLRSKL
jgi:hypothetical protein